MYKLFNNCIYNKVQKQQELTTIHINIVYAHSIIQKRYTNTNPNNKTINVQINYLIIKKGIQKQTQTQTLKTCMCTSKCKQGTNTII